MDRLQIEERLTASQWMEGLQRNARRGLTSLPKTLPPKYFYDEEGSALYDRICDLPEYYLPRAETEILARHAATIAKATSPSMLIEFGPGSATKTQLLLEALSQNPAFETYAPIEVNGPILKSTLFRLLQAIPRLRGHGIIDDFTRPLSLPSGGSRLIAFLGSTIGNFEFSEAVVFLRRVASQLNRDDRLLLGTDLVKDRRSLELAYNDPSGVTAEFNRNVLKVLNRHLEGDFNPAAFRHSAPYNEAEDRIEMYLISQFSQRVVLKAIDLEVEFASGETLRTEISCKYTPHRVKDMLRDAGLQLLEWFEDEQGRLAVSLSAP